MFCSSTGCAGSQLKLAGISQWLIAMHHQLLCPQLCPAELWEMDEAMELEWQDRIHSSAVERGEGEPEAGKRGTGQQRAWWRWQVCGESTGVSDAASVGVSMPL